MGLVYKEKASKITKFMVSTRAITGPVDFYANKNHFLI